MKLCDNCTGVLEADGTCHVCAFGDRIYAKAHAGGMVRRPPKRIVNQTGIDLGVKKYLTGQDAALPPSDR